MFRAALSWETLPGPANVRALKRAHAALARIDEISELSKNEAHRAARTVRPASIIELFLWYAMRLSHCPCVPATWPGLFRWCAERRKSSYRRLCKANRARTNTSSLYFSRGELSDVNTCIYCMHAEQFRYNAPKRAPPLRALAFFKKAQSFMCNEIILK